MDRLKAVFIGVARDPFVVATARAILLYCLPIGAAAGVAYINEWTDPRLVPLVPLAVALIRAVEGAIDKTMKPSMNRIDPPPVAGGGERELLS